jgi:hypothetical protein
LHAFIPLRLRLDKAKYLAENILVISIKQKKIFILIAIASRYALCFLKPTTGGAAAGVGLRQLATKSTLVGEVAAAGEDNSV